MRVSTKAWAKNRRKFQAWAKRSNAVQAVARLLRDPDFETQRRHALDDRRGTVVKEGVSWIDGKETRWQVRHALRPARTNQLELVANGIVVRVCGARRLPRRFRP